MGGGWEEEGWGGCLFPLVRLPALLMDVCSMCVGMLGGWGVGRRRYGVDVCFIGEVTCLLVDVFHVCQDAGWVGGRRRRDGVDVCFTGEVTCLFL